MIKRTIGLALLTLTTAVLILEIWNFSGYGFSDRDVLFLLTFLAIVGWIGVARTSLTRGE